MSKTVKPEALSLPQSVHRVYRSLVGTAFHEPDTLFAVAAYANYREIGPCVMLRMCDHDGAYVRNAVGSYQYTVPLWQLARDFVLERSPDISRDPLTPDALKRSRDTWSTATNKTRADRGLPPVDPSIFTTPGAPLGGEDFTEADPSCARDMAGVQEEAKA